VKVLPVTEENFYVCSCSSERIALVLLSLLTVVPFFIMVVIPEAFVVSAANLICFPFPFLDGELLSPPL